jgi:hypothetical protein
VWVAVFLGDPGIGSRDHCEVSSLWRDDLGGGSHSVDLDGWPMNWKVGGVMSLTCAGVVFVGFCHVSESARMRMSWLRSKPVIAPGRLRVQG